MLIETLRICVNVLAVRSFKQIFKFEFVLILSFCIYSDLAYFPFFLAQPVDLESVRVWQSEEAEYFENEFVNGKYVAR